MQSVYLYKTKRVFPKSYHRQSDYAVRKLDYSRATDDQANVIREFEGGRDVFCHVPTGSSKSLRYAALPFVFDFLRVQSESPSTVVIVYPLQVRK